jgi:CheY-like chemotaxis protein
VPHTLLLADDSVTIQRVIELTFADEDIQVVAVGDGDQAIAVLDRTPPDIVLADIGMPGKSGYEVARHVRDSPNLAHIPVLLLTGAFEPVDEAKAAAVGCDGVLAKPFEPQLVIGRVKDLLARAGPPPSPREAPGPAASAWAAPEPHAAAGGAGAPAVPEEYFDRLDRAFATLTGAEPEPDRPAGPFPGTTDWFAPAPSAPAETRSADARQEPPPAPEVPLSYRSSSEAFARAQPAPEFPEPPAAGAVPPLAEAFTALLAAEQAVPPPAAAPAWPAGPAGPTQVFVDEVARRVLERIAGDVRGSMSDIVVAVAERLVREEIERVRQSIR